MEEGARPTHLHERLWSESRRSEGATRLEPQRAALTPAVAAPSPSEPRAGSQGLPVSVL